MNVYAQTIDCKKHIKLIESKEGYDPSGELITPIKIPIDDTSGLELTISGTGFTTSMYINCYGVTSQILDGRRFEISMTNHESIKLLINGVDGTNGVAVVTFGKGMAENRFSEAAFINDITDLAKLGESKIRGFRIVTSGPSIGVLFPPEKQEYFKNAINCILNL